MTNEQPQAIQPTPADIAALGVKIEAFAATLSPAERLAFGHLLQRALAADEDTQGYVFGDVLALPAQVTLVSNVMKSQADTQNGISQSLKAS